MARTIDSDAKTNIRASFEIDKMAQRYKTTNTIYTFTAPSLTVINNNLFFLLRNSSEISLDQKYWYKPSYLSYDTYGVVNLDYLLMYVNGVLCVEEFNIPVVVIPTLDSIIQICQYKFPIPTNPDNLPSLDI